jgi:type 1 glutamine amidotransferase
MRLRTSKAPLAAAVCAATWFAATIGVAQQPPPAGPAASQAPAGGGRAGGGGRGGVAPGLFTAADANKDGAVTREELKASFDKWFADSDTARTGAVTQEQLLAALTAALPQPAAPAAPQPDPCGGRSAQPRVPCPADVQAMMAALPATAPAKPSRPRKVLVIAATSGFVHSSIPLAARMVEEMGNKTGAWTTTVTYDRADVTAENLKQYDAIFLDSTTGTFLDEPGSDTDPAAKATTDARRKALMDFIRNGKGIAGIHAATDSYHGNPAPPGGRSGAPAGLAGGGRGGGRGAAGTLAPLMLAQGDSNADQKLSKAEAAALADAWFDKVDPQKAGTVSQADFAQRFAAVMPAPQAPPAAAAGAGGGGGSPLWPEWNKTIGGYFKHHWNYPTKITVRIDDPKSPLTAPFKGQPFDATDEVYTYNQDSFSRANVHVLTSIDYSKMSDAVKAQEQSPRTDHDFALSWIRREGKGRLFYEALGHHESIYAGRPMLEHILAGIQYAIGDLKADDSPSAKGGTKD